MGDPAAKVPGYTWYCTNCSNLTRGGLRAWWTSKLVKIYMNPATPLPGMGKTATIYCPDCPEPSRLYCTGCAGRLHNVGTKTGNHSLEAIDPTKRSLFYLAPVFDMLLLPTILFLTVLTVGLPANYMSGRDVCPTTHFVRSRMYHLDAGLTIFLKDKLASTCNLEDGYFRLIIDTWVRAISTNSDSFLLLYSAVVRGLVFHTVAIRCIIVPILVCLNAFCGFSVHLCTLIGAHFGWGTFRLLPPEWQKRLSILAKDLQAGCEAAAFKIQWWVPLTGMLLPKKATSCFPKTMFQIPPATLPRLRPRMDYMDAYKYWTGRQKRVLNFFLDTAKIRLEILVAVVPVVAVVVRMLCITTSFGWYLRILFLLPGDGAQVRQDIPGDALGYAIDRIVKALLPVAVTFVPVSSMICGGLVYIIYRYPRFRYSLDQRGWYGSQCGGAPMTVTTGKCRFFPKTFEPEETPPPPR